MKRHITRAAVSRTAPSLALLASLACAGAPVHAGSLTVRDANGAWTVEDPQPGANDFLLKHLIAGTNPDEHFGRNGQTAFTLGAADGAPVSVRVDATHRTWMVGASLVGNQPRPVIVRFNADGNADPGWGEQGRLEVGPSGIAIKPNDLLPLADGSVLVAGEVIGVATPRAAVFHVKADGSLDRRFGADGVWQRAEDGNASTATSLAASTGGVAAVAVAVRGAKPGSELWGLTDLLPTVIQRAPVEDNSDGADLRAEWSNDHWALANGGGPTPVVPPALLTNHAPSDAPVAASDPAQGGLDRASAGEQGRPLWISIALAAAVLAAAVGGFALRARKAVARKPPSA